ncbi:hypothetical protein LCGC14_0629360 [marine sediment metagenome]|uniref:Uncharacterized protein n=1 Tax=marine sediment metagenome TaxID=412755 RepID=A0A0F9TNY0_9ZZZZ
MNANVLEALRSVDDLLTKTLAEAPAVTSKEQVDKELLLQARIKIQEAISIILRG